MGSVRFQRRVKFYSEFWSWSAPVLQKHIFSKVPERDAPLKPRMMEMPPLLKQVMVRNRAAKNEVTRESDLLLPAYKIFEGDVRYDDKPEPHILSRFITDEFATFKGKFWTNIGAWGEGYYVEAANVESLGVEFILECRVNKKCNFARCK